MNKKTVLYLLKINYEYKDFKKWLIKNRIYHDFCKTNDYKTDCIAIKDLGEWAVENIKKRVKLDEIEPNVGHYPQKYVSIAVACLGQKTVLKILLKRKEDDKN